MFIFLCTIEPYSVSDYLSSFALVVSTIIVGFLFLKLIRHFTIKQISKSGGMNFTHSGKPDELLPKDVRHTINDELSELIK